MADAERRALAAAKPKLSDVWWLTVDLLPVTTCYPPEGHTCYFERGRTGYSGAEAKRHAFENPGHEVTREAIKRTRYLLDPDEVTP
jgi:hypothetical protein